MEFPPIVFWEPLFPKLLVVDKTFETLINKKEKAYAFSFLFALLTTFLLASGFAFRLLLSFLGLFRFALTPWISRWRFVPWRGLVICCIKPRTFKNDLGGGDHFSQWFFSALGAGLQGCVIKRLVTFKLHAAWFATIGINWHFVLLAFEIAWGIIARLGTKGKGYICKVGAETCPTNSHDYDWEIIARRSKNCINGFRCRNLQWPV